MPQLACSIDQALPLVQAGLALLDHLLHTDGWAARIVVRNSMS